MIGGGVALFGTQAGSRGLINAVRIAGVMFYLPAWCCGSSPNSRKDAIFSACPTRWICWSFASRPDLGLDQADAEGQRGDEERLPDRLRGVRAVEFPVADGVGRSVEVLHELGSRTGVDDLRSLAAILIQADKFGSSIAQALRVQSDSMRTKRRQLAEEKAAKTAVKLIFPLVIFIFPAIFVVLVGPAAITMVNEMFPAMAGK